MEINKKCWVVKVGTSTITNDNGSINLRILDRLCRVLSEIESMGYEVVLVSSGAIAVGVSKMRLAEKPKDIALKQATAAVGQCELMHLYDKFFGEYGRMVGQILMTSEDIADDVRRENLTGTLRALRASGVIPIVNENDSVSHTEIESEKKIFGDNDMLSAIVAKLCGAGKLVILSDIEGLYDSNPKENPDAKVISRVEDISDAMRASAGGAGSSRGTGGMISKLEAAEYATNAGIDMLITLGKNPEALYDIIDGKKIGTLFVAKE